MNIVFNLYTVLAMMMITVGIVLPRLLVFFGAKFDFLTQWTTPWATFIILLIAGLLWFNIKLKARGWFLFVRIAIIFAVAFFVTFYFCDLQLPW